MEARGVEPLSENRPTRLSPSALGIFHSLTQAPAQRVLGLVASYLLLEGQSFPPNRAPPNGVSTPPGGQDGRNVAALRCECDFVFVRVYFFCRLLSQLRRLRLAYPASRVPVETVTPPCLLFLPFAERAFHLTGIVLGLGRGALIIELFALANAYLQLCSVF